MLRLRKILLCDYLYILILLVIILISLIRITTTKEAIYKEQNIISIKTVTNYFIDGNTLTINLKGNNKTIGKYYFKTLKDKERFEKNIKLGDKIKVSGELKIPQKNTTENLFNYQKYLSYKKIYYTIKINAYQKISSNNSIYYFLKQKIKDRLNKNAYLNTFILGDKSYLSTEAISSYQENGISHLFAISGMHISLLSGILLLLLKKTRLNENSKYFITSIFLLIYLFIANTSASIIRGVLFFIFFSINKIFYFYIKPINIFILVLSLTLLINPFYIYDIGFQYSFLISFYLIILSENIKDKSYLISLLKVSLISFYVSIPITIYNFYQINLLSIIYNLFFVPLVSFIIFPLSLVTIFFSFIEPIYNFLTTIMENISIFISQIDILKLTFKKIPLVFYIIYIILIHISLTNKNKKPKIIITLLLVCHTSLMNFNNNVWLKTLDVGQGDSSILRIKNEIILIDTGGKEIYEEEWSKKVKDTSIVKNITIPLLKSIGIKKINTLIITHGDYDHMGEAINLVENFKVEKVIFNCGEFNELEQELIEVLDKKKIPYYSCIKELNIDNNKLYFLNNKDYGNENDNSSVIYTEFNNHKFLFMGDAGVEAEEDLIEKYNLKDIDVLKVGHHGSKTSSSKIFIDEVNPKYSIISVGKNNRYGHPNISVLDNLEDSKIYRTDQDGSIVFKVKKNKLQIEICPP